MKIELSNNIIYVILGISIILIMGLGVYAYGTSNPQVFGHSAGEIEGLSTIPSGAVMFFDLVSCPAGWTELTDARGMYIVGLQQGGTLKGTQGTALTNLENRAVGQHTHSVSDPGHSHVSSASWSAGQSAISGGTRTIPTGAPTSATTGISIANAGSVVGTNAPYIQLLICRKN